MAKPAEKLGNPHIRYSGVLDIYIRYLFTPQANNYRSRKQKRNRLSLLCGVETHTRLALASLILFNSIGKNVLFAHSTSQLPPVLAPQDTGHHQTWRAYAKLNCLLYTSPSPRD